MAQITIAEAAAILGEPYYHVLGLIRAKPKPKLKAKKFGWTWQVDKSSVLALKAARDKTAKSRINKSPKLKKALS